MANSINKLILYVMSFLLMSSLAGAYGWINGSYYGVTSNITYQVGNLSSTVGTSSGTRGVWLANYGEAYIFGDYNIKALVDSYYNKSGDDFGYFYAVAETPVANKEFFIFFDLTNTTDVVIISNKTIIDTTSYVGQYSPFVVTVYTTSDKSNHNNASDIPTLMNLTSVYYNMPNGGSIFDINYSSTSTRYLVFRFQFVAGGTDRIPIRELMIYGDTPFIKPPPISSFGECNSTYTTISLNISIFNESSNNHPANITLDQNYNLDNGEQFLFTNTSISNFKLCKYSNDSINISGLLHYYGEGFVSRYYFLPNIQLSGTTQEIYLYTINSLLTTRIYTYWTDEDDNEITDAYVRVSRYYPELNQYLLVEISKTDTNGLAIVNLVPYTTYYKFELEEKGIITYSTIKVITQSTEYFIVRKRPNFLDNWQKFRDIQFKFIFINSTNTYSFSYTDVRNVANEICLKVSKMKSSGETILSDACQTNSAGTIAYTLNPMLNNTHYVAIAYMKSSPPVNLGMISTIRSSIKDVFGLSGVWITMLYIIGLALIVPSPAIGIILTVIGLISSFAVGFVTMSYTGIVIMIILAIYFMIKGEAF